MSAQAFFPRTRFGHILTILLFIAYAGSILVLVALGISWIGVANSMVITGFTLVLAILLNPVRCGFQKAINRRHGLSPRGTLPT